ncbi:MAG: 16S rRNA (cytosine(1402)-N(4))-methyltransferase RsmH [Gammaproteobacteria bacterium]|nr:16S rRNA (cytosine(1402)-N(4))-methyltransferase RsmH [Gammaproteobacteria bacterium]
MNITEYDHTPVLLNEVLQGLKVSPGGFYVDCTFGRGGHSRAILRHLSEQGRLVAIDKDPDAIAAANDEMRNDPRITLLHGPYTMLKKLIEAHKMLGQVDGILFDLGVSSPQLDDPARGFSFQKDCMLDMRMDNTRGMTAAEWLSSAREAEITEVLQRYGEERYARRIARAIIRKRSEKPFRTTQQLAQLVSEAVPTREKDKHPATRTFQAIRIFLNNELDELSITLKQTIDVLKIGGRLVVISFHSLEDRLVKRFMRNESRGDKFPPEIPVTHELITPRLKIIDKPIYPSEKEISENPRARSAVMRIAERVRG